MKLQSCLLLCVFTIVFCFNNGVKSRPRCRKIERVKVLILGAGVAGINAAKTLKDKGLQSKDFLILEAQDYVGGRYKNVPFANTRIEEGANWVHHTQEENALWDLARKYRLKGNFTPYEDYQIRDENGSLSQDVKNLRHEMHVAENNLVKVQENRTTQKLSDLSVRIGLQMAGWKPQTPAQRVVEYFSMDFEFGSNPETSSTFGFAKAGKDFFVHDPRGYGHMWKEMAKEFSDRIRLNTVVTRVYHREKKVYVITASGDWYIANYALVTFSHGVLSNDVVKFIPELPKWKMESIYKMPMCYYTKIFIKFPKKFWDDNTWILYAHKNRGYFPVWMNVEIPGIAPKSGILHVTVTGDQGLRVENQPKAVTLKEIMHELRKVYGRNIPDPEDIFISAWSKNPYVRGSYSNAVPGTMSEDYHNLQTPVGRLYFAGEGTSSDWWGYGNGAHETGIKQANRIWRCLLPKKSRKCPEILPKTNIVTPVNLDANGNIQKTMTA